MIKKSFRSDYVNELLNNIIGKTLGEIDSKKVFTKTIDNDKITGIAGDVLEQSVFGYNQNSDQEPDLVIDNLKVELKTTGIKKSLGKNEKYSYEAKEPMSITAVSPNKIINEEFIGSNLWHKMENMLLVYYLYDSKNTVKAKDYANFTIQGYHFNKFNEVDMKIIENDWKVVKDFIQNVKEKNLNVSEEYPKISQLRKKMMYLDTAPKYPNPPRFRLKRSVVTTIIQESLGRDFIFLEGNKGFTSYIEMDKVLSDFTIKYYGLSIREIAKVNGIELEYVNGTVSKQINEQILTAVFGVKNRKLKNIDTFAKVGVIPKTITITKEGYRTEDTKFHTVDFNEFRNEDIKFENSSLYEYFSNQVFLFTIFEERFKNSPIEDNIFKGFKRLILDENFIEKEVKKTWIEIKSLVVNKTFKVTSMLDKDGKYIINSKNQTIKEENNLPKSKKFKIFIRGTSKDSTVKNEVLNGYRIYSQQYWIKGSVLVNLLEENEFIK